MSCPSVLVVKGRVEPALGGIKRVRRDVAAHVHLRQAMPGAFWPTFSAPMAERKLSATKLVSFSSGKQSSEML